MLTVSTASRLAVSGARRTVVVAAQTHPVQVVRRTSAVRGIQSIAQTDRVGHFLHQPLKIFTFFFWLGYHYPFIVFHRDQARGRTPSSDFFIGFASFAAG